MTSESLTVTFGQTTTYTVQSAYDAANRRTGITYPDGSVVARSYTARDQLSQIDYNTDMVARDPENPSDGLIPSEYPGEHPGYCWAWGFLGNRPLVFNFRWKGSMEYIEPAYGDIDPDNPFVSGAENRKNAAHFFVAGQLREYLSKWYDACGKRYCCDE